MFTKLEIILIVGFMVVIFTLFRITQEVKDLKNRIKILDVKLNLLEVISARIFQATEDIDLPDWWNLKSRFDAHAIGEMKMDEVDQLVEFAERNNITFHTKSRKQLFEEQQEQLNN